MINPKIRYPSFLFLKSNEIVGSKISELFKIGIVASKIFRLTIRSLNKVNAQKSRILGKKKWMVSSVLLLRKKFNGQKNITKPTTIRFIVCSALFPMGITVS
jgi:hypothetical protein